MEEIKEQKLDIEEPTKETETAAWSSAEYKALIDQVRIEYKLSKDYLKPKKDKWKLRLRLYNNQKRNEEAIGDPLMFTTMQTVMANLYNDSLSSEFVPAESGDIEKTENLTLLYEHDSSIMQKDQIDYAWDWDACFFGRGILLMQEFCREAGIMCPIPQIISPLVFYRDPRASTINGDILGRGGCRFLGRDVQMTKTEMESNQSYKNLSLLKSSQPVLNSGLKDYQIAKDDAQDRDETANNEDSPNKKIDNCQLLQWFTWFKGKRVEVILGNEGKLIVRYQVLKNQKKFPLITRAIYPSSDDWDATSIPDMTEDKQRARAVISNLGLKSVKASINPMYLYNSTKITNRNSLKFGFNKFVPVNGEITNAIAPIQRDQINADAQFILNLLDTAAQKATASPQQLQGVQAEGDATATEVNKVSAGADTRQSLSAKIFGWSEKDFARQWYRLYKENFSEDIDEKQLRICGALNYQFRPIRREDIISEIDPDVKVESKIMATAERQIQLQGFTNFIGMAISYPDTNKIISMRQFGRLNSVPIDVVNAIIPPTIDELDANDENLLLNKNKIALVEPSDDHNMHLWIHNKADDTSAKYAHIKAHRKALLLKKQHPERFPAEQMQDNMQPSDSVLKETVAPVAPVKNSNSSYTNQ